MMRRPPMRRGRGLVGTIATTAVVAGTATAVNTRMTDRHYNKQAAAQQEQAADQAAFESQQQIAQMQQQMAALQAQQAAGAAGVAPAAPTTSGADLMTQLQQLTQMKDAGALTEAEFQAAKAKLLGT
jgi:threonine dehydrogenase-like Zn-dependent dehydrogenase